MITPRNCLTTLEDLQEWWMNQPDCTKWTLFSGSNLSTSGTIHRNDVSEDKNESWSQLETMIRNLSRQGGHFTILAKKNKQTNNGPRVQLYIDPLGQQSGMGINGINQNSESYINSRINEAVEKLKLQQEIDSLRYELEQGQPLTEKLLARICEHPQLPQLVDVFIAKFLGRSGQAVMAGFGQTQPINENQNMNELNNEGIADKTPKNVDVQSDHGPSPENRPEAGSQMSPDISAAPPSFIYDGDKLAPSLERIRKVFPDIYVFMDTLAQFVEKNPGLANQFFKTHNAQK